MLNKLSARARGESGFTLVELLVVMLILGLLAAIAIPSFFAQRDKARDSEAKSAVRTAQTAIEAYATDNGGSYTGAKVTGAVDSGRLQDIEPTLEQVGTRLTLPVAAGDKTYEVQVASTTSGQTFKISRAATGVTTLTCTVDGKAGCPSGGNWGG